MGLTAFTVRGNISSGTTSPKPRTSESANAEGGPSAFVNFEMVEMMCTGYVPPEVLNPEINIRETPEQMLKKAELIKWKMVEIFKVSSTIRTAKRYNDRSSSISSKQYL